MIDSSNISRRRFLQTTGTAMTAGAVWHVTGGPAGAANSKTGAVRLHKAVKYGMVRGKMSVLEKFQLLKRIGFEGVDINTRLDHRTVQNARDKSGLVVHGVVGYDHWGKPLSDPDPNIRAAGLASLKGALRDSKAYGGTTVLLVPGKVTKQVSYADAYKRSQAEIRKAIPLAEKLGIRILIENVWNNFLLSPLELAHYIDEFDSPIVGSYFDIGNVVRYGWPDQWIRILGKRIGKLDIKPYSRKLQFSKGPGAGFGVKLGDGDIDWSAVMKALRDIDYHGWATAEVGGGNAERLSDISQRMDRVFAR